MTGKKGNAYGRKIVVHSTILEHIHKAKMNISVETFDVLEKKLREQLDTAIKRARDNFRTTVMPKDF